MAVGKRRRREQPESHAEWNTLHSSLLGSGFGELGTAVFQTKTSPTRPLASQVLSLRSATQAGSSGGEVN